MTFQPKDHAYSIRLEIDGRLKASRAVQKGEMGGCIAGIAVAEFVLLMLWFFFFSKLWSDEMLAEMAAGVDLLPLKRPQKKKLVGQCFAVTGSELDMAERSSSNSANCIRRLCFRSSSQ